MWRVRTPVGLALRWCDSITLFVGDIRGACKFAYPEYARGKLAR